MLDWLALRKALIAIRERSSLTRAAWARKIEVDKSTAGRVEDLDGLPDHKPDLDTIDKWLAPDRLSLSLFIRQFEVLTEPQTRATTTLPFFTKRAADGDSALPAFVLELDPTTAQAIEWIALAALRAVRDSLPDRPATSPDVDESESGTDGSGVGGPDHRK